MDIEVSTLNKMTVCFALLDGSECESEYEESEEVQEETDDMDVEDGSGTETEPETTADVQGQDKASLN